MLHATHSAHSEGAPLGEGPAPATTSPEEPGAAFAVLPRFFGGGVDSRADLLPWARAATFLFDDAVACCIAPPLSPPDSSPSEWSLGQWSWHTLHEQQFGPNSASFE